MYFLGPLKKPCNAFQNKIWQYVATNKTSAPDAHPARAGQEAHQLLFILRYLLFLHTSFRASSGRSLPESSLVDQLLTGGRDATPLEPVHVTCSYEEADLQVGARVEPTRRTGRRGDRLVLHGWGEVGENLTNAGPDAAACPCPLFHHVSRSMGTHSTHLPPRPLYPLTRTHHHIHPPPPHTLSTPPAGAHPLQRL